MLYTAYYNPLPLQIYLHNDLEGWLQVWHYQSSSEFHTGMWKTSLWSIPHSLCTPCPTQVSLLGFLHTCVDTPVTHTSTDQHPLVTFWAWKVHTTSSVTLWRSHFGKKAVQEAGAGACSSSQMLGA